MFSGFFSLSLAFSVFIEAHHFGNLWIYLTSIYQDSRYVGISISGSSATIPLNLFRALFLLFSSHYTCLGMSPCVSQFPEILIIFFHFFFFLLFGMCSLYQSIFTFAILIPVHICCWDLLVNLIISIIALFYSGIFFGSFFFIICIDFQYRCNMTHPFTFSNCDFL